MFWKFRCVFLIITDYKFMIHKHHCVQDSRASLCFKPRYIQQLWQQILVLNQCVFQQRFFSKIIWYWIVSCLFFSHLSTPKDITNKCCFCTHVIKGSRLPCIPNIARMEYSTRLAAGFFCLLEADLYFQILLWPHVSKSIRLFSLHVFTSYSFVCKHCLFPCFCCGYRITETLQQILELSLTVLPHLCVDLHTVYFLLHCPS